MASCFDLHLHGQNPAISSLASANGPSITVRLSPENLTRAPLELGWSPSPASITPAFTSSSLKLPIAARSFSSGRTPASVFLSALMMIMNRIAVSPSGFVSGHRSVSAGSSRVLPSCRTGANEIDRPVDFFCEYLAGGSATGGPQTGRGYCGAYDVNTI